MEVSVNAAVEAAAENRIYSLQHLSRAGVDMGDYSDSGQTPLIAAIRNGSRESIDFLFPKFQVERTLHVKSKDTNVSAFEEAIHSGDFVLAEKIHRIVDEFNVGESMSVADVLTGTASLSQDSFGHLRELGIDPIKAISEPDENMPLIVAVARKDGARIKQLIQAGADVDFVLPNGETLLVTAIRSGDPDLAISLMNAGAAVNAPLTEKLPRGEPDIPVSATPIEAAMIEGDLTMLEILLHRGADPDRFRSDGDLPLVTAILDGDVVITRLLLEGGVDFTDPVFAQAALETRNVPLLRTLLEAGLSPDLEIEKGVRLLDRAVQMFAMGACKALVDAGANVQGTLIFAMQEGNAEQMDFLLESGVDWNELGGDQGSVLMDFALSTENQELLEVLLRRGATADALRTDGESWVSHLLREHNHELASRLIEAGASIPLPSPPTPIFW